MNILMINQPLNNRGDEAAHKALLRTICSEVPNVRIKIVFVEAMQDSIRQFDINYPHIQYINLKRIKGMSFIANLGLRHDMKFLWHLHPTISQLMELYKEADLILCAPGGICMGGFQNWGHLFMLQLAKYMNKQLAYYGRSFGPFPTATQRNRQFKELSLEMLHYFSFLSIRDKRSEQLADSLAVKYVSTVDSAFLDSQKVEIPHEIKDMIGEKPYIVFVPNQLNWHFAFKNIPDATLLKFYSGIIDILVERYPNHSIVMLPQTFNVGHGRDFLYFEKIKEINRQAPLVSIPDIYSSDIQQTIIAGAQCVIGARYHSIVFAINNNVPFVSLSYEHKMSGLLATLQHEEMMVDISQAFLSEDKIKDTLQAIKNKLYSEYEKNEMKEQAENIAKKCFNIFKNKFYQP